MRELEVPLDRDLFFRQMIRSFARSPEETIGMEEAEGYVSLVGSDIGNWIEEQYKDAAEKKDFSPEGLANLLVDLKRRIGGDFFVKEVSEERIVLGNNDCPFGKLAAGRESLCQMTSNVFGRITANQLGYARVDLVDTIAKGDDGCHIVIHLLPADGKEDVAQEFYRIEEPGS
ncbi:methanogen output domain 1-containing protein [Sphingomicrobium sp. XHP0235]|uniref:methanogen output domain 1-containing protein n=1 Tax=Sphingomicrobium aquimarinum TaxID=3133971 RepID=UPI0031FEAFA8